MHPINYQKQFEELVSYKMPFGKYKDHLVCELPEYYLVWYRSKGFPKGKLGELMGAMYEIRLNGLEKILDPIKKIKNKKT